MEVGAGEVAERVLAKARKEASAAVVVVCVAHTSEALVTVGAAVA